MPGRSNDEPGTERSWGFDRGMVFEPPVETVILLVFTWTLVGEAAAVPPILAQGD